MSFLKHYAKLAPDEIIVLHPLSYLIKPRNFKSLSFFTSLYKLEEATVFSSKEFGNSIDKNRTPFPIICAKYIKGKTTYEQIKNFSFKILNSKHSFNLKNFYTIDDYGICKYPTKNSKSDINLYHYNIRDTNSLLTSGNITETSDDKNYITIMFDKLYQYCYLQCYRKYFPKEASLKYLIGNLSAPCNTDDLDSEIFRDLCIMDTIFSHRNRIKAFDKTNTESFIYKNFLINKLRRNKNNHKLYKLFLDYIDKDYNCEKDFKNYFKAYFLNLLENQIGFNIN